MTHLINQHLSLREPLLQLLLLSVIIGNADEALYSKQPGVYKQLSTDKAVRKPLVFIAAATGSMVLTWFTIGFQSFRAASRNPIAALRDA